MAVSANKVKTANITLQTIVTLSLQGDKIKGTSVALTTAASVSATAIEYESYISTSPTPFYALGQALITTDQSHFGSHSLSLPNADAGAISASIHSKFYISTSSSFSIAFWYYPTANSSGSRDDIVSWYDTGGDIGWGVQRTTTRGIRFFIQDGTTAESDETGGTVLTLNDWNWVVVTRTGTTLEIYVNGTQRASDATHSAGSDANGKYLRIGDFGSGGAVGYLDGLHITIGSTISTAVPTEDTLGGTANSKLLLNWNGSWIDQSLSAVEQGAAALSSTATVSANGTKIPSSSAASLISASSLSASATRNRFAQANLSSAFSLTVSALDLDLAQATLTSTTSISVVFTVIKGTSAALTSVATVSSTAKITRSSAVSLTSTATVTATVRRTRSAQSSLSSTATVVANILSVTFASASLSAQSSLSAQPNRNYPRPLDLTLGTGTFDSTNKIYGSHSYTVSSAQTGWSLASSPIYTQIQYVDFWLGITAFSGGSDVTNNILVLGNQFTIGLEYTAAPNRNYLTLNGNRATSEVNPSGNLGVGGSASTPTWYHVIVVKSGNVWTLTVDAIGSPTVSITQASSYSGTINYLASNPRSKINIDELVFADSNGPSNILSSGPWLLTDQSDVQGLYHFDNSNSDDVGIRQVGASAQTVSSQLTVDPSYIFSGRAQVVSVASAVITARKSAVGTVAISSQATVSTVNTRVRSATAALTSTSTLSCSPGLIKGSAVTLTSTSSVTANATRVLRFNIVTSAIATELTVAVKTGRTLVTIESSASLTAVAVKDARVIVNAVVASTMTCAAVKTARTGSTQSSAFTQSTINGRLRNNQIVIAGQSTLVASARKLVGVTVNAQSVSSIVANAKAIFLYAIPLTSQFTVTAFAVAGKIITANLVSTATITAPFIRRRSVSAAFTAFNTQLTIGTKITLDPYYQLVVARELSVKKIRQETAILTLDAENRLNTVQLEDRTLRVPRETSTWHIPYSPQVGTRRVK
jgi:hypothetical protein